MMKDKISIAFDVTCLGQPQLTGIGIVAKNLFLELKKIPGLNIRPVFKSSRYKRKHFAESHLNQKVQLWYPWSHLFHKIDLYHGPDYKIPKFGSFKKLVTVHDIIEFDGLFHNKEFTETAKKNFINMLNHCSPDWIHTVSEFSASRLIHFFPQLENRVTSIYPGIDHSRKETLQKLPIDLPENYILFLSTLEERKNINRIIESFEIFNQNHKNFHLLLAGRWGNGKDAIEEKLKNSNSKTQIFHLDFVPNDWVPELFKHAKVFIYPSLYEGFGLPALEAMMYKCPVITSNTTSLNEVSGNAALKVNPESVLEISDALEKIISDFDLKNQLIFAGLKHSREFTWSNSAQKMHQLYLKILN